MKRILGVLVLVAAIVFPAFTWNTGSATVSTESTSIGRYRADYTVDKDGTLRAVETIPVDIPAYESKHGIFRFFDSYDPSAPRARRIAEDIQVTRDGASEPFELLSEGHGRYQTAKIGSAYYTLPEGVHTYQISYRIDGVLEPGTDGTTTQFYWNLVPGGWAQTMDSTRLTVRLPAPPKNVRCAVGVGATRGCEAQVNGEMITVETGPLAPRTPVTIKAGLDIATPPAANELPWPARWLRVFGTSILGAILVVLLGLLAGLAGLGAARASREDDPAFPLMYAPPEGIGPAQAAYLLNERTNKQAFVASLMYAAEQGAITVERSDRAGGQWTITDRGGPATWKQLDPITRRIARLLPAEGGTFVADSSRLEAGRQLRSELASFDSETKTWAGRKELLEGAGIGEGAALLTVGGIALAAVMCFWNPQSMSLAALIPGLFAIAALPTLKPGAATRRTPAGRDLWSRIGGFYRVLSTPSSIERFEFSGRKELYTAYLPWAVAFGVADQWAQKYRTEMGVEPPAPAYFAGGYTGAHTGSYVNQMVNDFDSTVQSSISAYEASIAPQSSSGGGWSGGGGGFSGGGGGGGGGGGSW